MWQSGVLLLALLALGGTTHLPGGVGAASDDPFAVPAELLIGAGVSAVQTEGAWNVDGKSESAIDHIYHTDNSSAYDRAADSYHLYKQDVAMAAKLKLKLYRFSMSWPRLLPTADATNPNPKGVQFYHNLLDEIIANNMTPLVTLYHFDHPRILGTQFNGWYGAEMVTKFREYAQFVFNEYSSKVKLWTTINEPNVYCSYFKPLPQFTKDAINSYTCTRHMILAHAEAYHVFQDDGHQGQVGFAAQILYAQPNTTRPEDIFAANVYNEIKNGLVFNPVVNGDFPQLLKDLGDIPIFSPVEKERISRTTDFLGINVYGHTVISYPELDEAIAAGSDPTKLNLKFQQSSDAIRNAVLWVWQSYKLPIIITENGLEDVNGPTKKDPKRAEYYSGCLRTLVSTMKEFQIKVIGYCAWSLIDSFEWSSAFRKPLGLVHVDYEGGTLERSLKESSQFWIDLADSGVVPYVAPSAASVTAASFSLLVLIATVTQLL